MFFIFFRRYLHVGCEIPSAQNWKATGKSWTHYLTSFPKKNKRLAFLLRQNYWALLTSVDRIKPIISVQTVAPTPMRELNLCPTRSQILDRIHDKLISILTNFEMAEKLGIGKQTGAMIRPVAQPAPFLHTDMMEEVMVKAKTLAT